MVQNSFFERKSPSRLGVGRLSIIERTVQEAQIIANNHFLRFPSDEHLEKSFDLDVEYGLDLPPSYEEVTKEIEQTKEIVSSVDTSEN